MDFEEKDLPKEIFQVWRDSAIHWQMDLDASTFQWISASTMLSQIGVDPQEGEAEASEPFLIIGSQE